MYELLVNDLVNERKTLMRHRQPRSIALAVLIMVPLVSLALAGNSHAQAKDPKSPIGVWKSIDDATGKAKSLIKIWEKNGKIYGTIIKLINPDEPNPLCDKCPGKLKNKPVKGMTIMRGLKKDGDEYSGGTIIDPENGKSYKVLIKVVDGGKRLKVRGYIGFSLLGRTQHWVRAK